MNDYFSVEAFRTWLSPTKTDQYDEQAIRDAQAEVIDLLEAWAFSAWPTVADPGPPGDGEAAAARSITETFDGGHRRAFLRVPIIEITTIELDGNAVDVESFTTHLDEGFIEFDSRLREIEQGLVITYKYGFTTTPQVVRRACMMATLGLLKQEKGGSSLPPNVSQYTTDRTTVLLNTPRDDDLGRPWPWHDAATRLIRAYWGPRRPRDLGVA